MKKILASIIVILAVGCVAAWSGNRLYQAHLSGEVERTLRASLDYNLSQADLNDYIKTGRLQIRTKRDQAEFDRLVKLAADRDNVMWLHQQIYGKGSDPVECHVTGMEKECQQLKELDRQFRARSKEAAKELESLRSDLGLPINVVKDEIDRRMGWTEADNWSWYLP
jgi:hypothetical protein